MHNRMLGFGCQRPSSRHKINGSTYCKYWGQLASCVAEHSYTTVKCSTEGSTSITKGHSRRLAPATICEAFAGVRNKYLYWNINIGLENHSCSKNPWCSSSTVKLFYWAPTVDFRYPSQPMHCAGERWDLRGWAPHAHVLADVYCGRIRDRKGRMMSH